MTDDEMINCRVPERQLERAIAIMHRLRAPGGCPWDAEQTHDSIVSNLIEECYESIDAIRARDWAHLREELGDVLLQVLFHAEMAQENPDAGFGINEIACELSDKLVRRHPHVFAAAQVADAEGVVSQWDQIKRREHDIEDKPYLQDCGKGLPSLLRAWKMTKKVAKVGFDWPEHAGVVDKIREETDEVAETLSLPDSDPRVQEELGDLLFTVVNLCRRRKVDPELALDAANRKFERRFNALEALLKARGIGLKEATAEQMEEAWQQVKAGKEC
ncbi:MAG TPA: nucleoside triphosphate pyrophosphohydrolase [Candidatus Akkermansia intestinigallinarum]|uniref:Nucleoside triphosphate pyrophosphohydrolase n=1 Tax=Candidatus Akkermansia intestinigallinarum TaxID=2838431 RepID=A0A9D2AH43_9BACT|nr:nucleoside triphosphate pyrophosphohydrolase [Candidatus Akkermansia intestinigallinarum]